jgi:NiFe hydrogenase small subunit HydA
VFVKKENNRKIKSLLWLQSAGCGGCTLSLLCTEQPQLFAALNDAGIELIWHPALSEESGTEASDLIRACASGELPLDILCIEGAMLRGPEQSGRFHVLSGTGRPTIDWVRELAARAGSVVAVGSCAAYGGIAMTGGNATDACGLQYEGNGQGGLLGAEFTSGNGLPVVNVAGCPTHPDWVLETLQLLAADALGSDDLDPYQRPKFFTDHLVHHGCPRNEYYEFKASALHPTHLGCLMENLGCKGTQAHADCNLRLWNGSGSCLRGGYACINCVEPEFEEPGHVFTETPKVAGIPMGLPNDMPKAWFVALASLSKSATPKRVKTNARSDKEVVAPSIRKGGRK